MWQIRLLRCCSKASFVWGRGLRRSIWSFKDLYSFSYIKIIKLNFDFEDWFWYQFEAILMPNSEKLVCDISKFVTWFLAPVRVIRAFASRNKEGIWRDQHKCSYYQYFRVKRVRVNCVGLYKPTQLNKRISEKNEKLQLNHVRNCRF